MDESVVYPVIIVLSKVYESYTSSLLLPFHSSRYVAAAASRRFKFYL